MPDRLRALVYRPGSLGDTLVSLPAIAEIRRRYPEHRLSLLTESQLAGSTRVSPWTILKETGMVRRRLLLFRPADVARRAMAQRGAGDAPSPQRLPRHLFARATADDAAAARRLVHLPRRGWRPALSRGTAARRGRRQMLTRRRSSTRGFACCASSIRTRAAMSLRTFRLEVPDIDRAMGRGLLNDLGVRPDQLLVGVGPGSGRSATAWPAERFAAVGSALLRAVPKHRAARDRRIERTAVVRGALRRMGTALAQSRRPAERVRLGVGPVAMRDVHRQRLRANASRGDGRHSVHRDLQRAQRAGAVGSRSASITS